MANKHFWVCVYSKFINPGVVTVTPLYVIEYFRTITAHPKVFYFLYRVCYPRINAVQFSDKFQLKAARHVLHYSELRAN